MLRTLGFNWNRRSARHANRSKSYNTFSGNGECQSMEREVFDANLLDVSTSPADSSEAEVEEVIRTRLRWHYMNPYQKFKLRRRKPWKLLLQILKIIMVTIQIFLFGYDRFSQVSFYDDNIQAFYDLFLEGNTTDFSLYVIPDVYRTMHYAHKQYYSLNQAIGSYSIKDDHNKTMSMLLVTYKYADGNISYNSYSFNTSTITTTIKLLPPRSNNPRNLEEFVTDNNISRTFDSLISFALNFNIRTVHLKDLKPSDQPDCFNFNVTILYDNARHDGRIFVSLTAVPTLFNCSGRINGESGERVLRNTYILYDCVVIIICMLSCGLCARSVIKHLHLAKEVGKFFQQRLNQRLTVSDYIEFINMWFILIILSDFLTISGSLCKILIDTKYYDDYDVCSLFLGLGVLLVWIGLLRYLTFLRKYNILLVTLKASAPSVLRFCLCAALLYFGFTFCGWIVLGPYHPKFRDIFTVSECLFSLLNGDDMFMTFKEMQKRSYAAWIFSKIYLYTFISLFIYVVLSLFIGIISDTYERMKDWGHPPCSRLQRFVHGVNCSRCKSEEGDADETPQTS